MMDDVLGDASHQEALHLSQPPTPHHYQAGSHLFAQIEDHMRLPSHNQVCLCNAASSLLYALYLLLENLVGTFFVEYSLIVLGCPPFYVTYHHNRAVSISDDRVRAAAHQSPPQWSKATNSMTISPARWQDRK